MNSDLSDFYDPILRGFGDIDSEKLLERLLLDPNWWHSVNTPWEIVLNWSSLGEVVSKLRAPGVMVNIPGAKSNIWIHPSAKLLPGAYIEGPAIIGPGCIVGPNCMLREFVFLDTNVIVGQGAEIKSSAVMKNSFLSHFCYLGHSLLGSDCSFSAGAITATRRFDDKTILVSWGGVSRDTGRKKVGAVIGNRVMLGVGTLIMPGKTIGPDSWIYPGTAINSEIPPGYRP